MSESEILCPECKRPIEREGERFCSWCRFPVMEIAGKYRLLTKLGEGGVGEVYLAEHIGLRRDDKRVLKFIKQEYLATESVIKRFRREMEVTSMLARRNQHIVQIFDDFGEVPGLGFFYAMEHVEGETLRSELQWRKRFGGQRALHIFQQLCEAMAVVHKEGLIHRDLKPENILLTTRNDEADFVKVIDFGLTRSLDGNVDTALTQGGVGTPAYMSPEQCANLPIDARTDIYAMGILLYEMLTGKLPFDLPHQSSGANMAAFAAHIMETPIPMRQRAPHLHISASLDRVILRALAKSPAERYPNTEIFWEALALFEGDICKEVPTDAFPLEEPEDMPHSSASHQPLPSGVLDAYAGAASDPIDQTVVSPPAIGEMVTLPVTFPPHPPTPAPPPRRLPSILLLLLGFGMASTLAAGFLAWWVYSGEPAGGSYVVKKLPKPHKPHKSTEPDLQPHTPHTPPQPATTTRVPLDQRRRPHLRPNRRQAPKQPGKGQATTRRAHKRRRPAQKLRIARAPSQKQMRRQRHRPQRPLNQTLAFEQSTAFRRAQQVLEDYRRGNGRENYFTAMKAYIALAQGYQKAGASPVIQERAYRQIIDHFHVMRRNVRTGALVFAKPVTRARFQLALLAFQKMKRTPISTQSLQQHRVDIEYQNGLLHHALRRFRESRRSGMLALVMVCSWTRQGDAYAHFIQTIEHSLALLDTNKTWSPYAKRKWQKRLFAYLRSSRYHSRRAYEKALSTARVHGYPGSAHCVQRAKKQLHP